MPIELACPTCRIALLAQDADSRRCERCDAVYPVKGGIWRCLRRGREQAVGSFVKGYAEVRRREGRSVRDAASLLALPYKDRSRRHSYEWFIRGRSFQTFLRDVLPSLENAHARPLRVLDAGSGVGWLAHRLAFRGHEVVAVDVVADSQGLGVHHLYPSSFVSVEAEIDALPLVDRSLDLIVYNAAFHYAARYADTLAEAMRVLAPGGRIVIMDSPLYRDRSSGEAMVRERRAAYSRQYGLALDDRPSEGFVTHEALSALSRELGLRWSFHRPWFGVRWWVKPRLARLRHSREPATFEVIVGVRTGAL